jgi:hypothetical protein
MTPFIRILPRGQMTREEFLHRHERFSRADAFLLGFAAGVACMFITGTLCSFLVRTHSTASQNSKLNGDAVERVPALTKP